MSSGIEIPKICVLKFEASWCGPCKAISPYIDELKKDYDKIPVIVIDADENQDICMKYGVTKLPTFVFLNGKTTSFVIGTDKTKISIEFNNLNKMISNQIQDQQLPTDTDARVSSTNRNKR